jgi:hypothetical protein
VDARVSVDAKGREMGNLKDDIERLNASLTELPELSNFEVSKQEAVRLRESTIRELQAEAYLLDKIAELVSARGVNITATTLKNYLHRAKTTPESWRQIASRVRRHTRRGAERASHSMAGVRTVWVA